MRFDRDLETLASIINGCEDWTSDKFKAGEIYRRMRAFVSATVGMPVGISWPFKKVRSLCEKPMEMIPGRYPDLYPPIVRDLLAGPFYQPAIDDGRITPPFTWNRSIIDLAFWLDTNFFARPSPYKVEGKEARRNWMQFDCVFRIDGEPVTAKQLRTAIKG